MIYTITLNPAIDFILETSGFEVGSTNYYQNDYVLIGGKGINTGIILNNLKASVSTTGFLGNENKNIFFEEFAKQKLKNNFIIFEGKTRTNFKIKNLIKKQETELNGVGSPIAPKLITDFLTYLKKTIKQNDIVVAAGSLPVGTPENIYQQIGEIVQEKKAHFCLDTSKKQMKYGLKTNPFLIKPNLDEIGEILNQSIPKNINLTEIKKLISQLQKLGARNVLLSMGADGSYFFGEDQSIYKVGIAHGKLVNSVGAGDSMLAGFVYGFHQNFDIKKNLQYAAAAGGATAFNQWLATKDQIEKYVDSIDVRIIEEVTNGTKRTV